MSVPSTYGEYELVVDDIEYETRESTGFLNGFYTVVKQRPVYTKIWEAVAKDSVTSNPGAQNPGNLQTSDGWRLKYAKYQKTRHQGLTRVLSECWQKTGAWETVNNN